MIISKSRLFTPFFEKEGGGGDLANKSPSIPLFQRGEVIFDEILIVTTQINRYRTRLTVQIAQALFPIDFDPFRIVVTGVKTHAVRIVTQHHVAASVNERDQGLRLILASIDQHDITRRQPVMIQAPADFVGGDLHRAECQTHQVDRHMQTVRRFVRSRFLHGRTVNHNEIQRAVVDLLIQAEHALQ